MKIIGIEFRLGYQNTSLAEVKIVPIEIEMPVCCSSHIRPEFDLTVHTSLGDVTIRREQLPSENPADAVLDLQHPYQAMQVIKAQLSGMPFPMIARKVLAQRVP